MPENETSCIARHCKPLVRRGVCRRLSRGGPAQGARRGRLWCSLEDVCIQWWQRNGRLALFFVKFVCLQRLSLKVASTLLPRMRYDRGSPSQACLSHCHSRCAAPSAWFSQRHDCSPKLSVTLPSITDTPSQESQSPASCHCCSGNTMKHGCALNWNGLQNGVMHREVHHEALGELRREGGVAGSGAACHHHAPGLPAAGPCGSLATGEMTPHHHKL